MMNDDYERIKAAARKRVLGSRRSRTRAMTHILFDDAPPFLAEEARSRRVEYVKGRMDVATAVAEAIADGVDPNTIETLTAPQVQMALAIQGRTVDFHDVVFVERSRKAANAVGRLLRGDQSIGTCFMISDRLLITNNHVIATETRAKECRAQFNFERDGNGGVRQVTTFELNPDAFFETDGRTHMDFSVIALGNPVGDGQLTPADLGSCPISPAKNKHVIGTFVNIIQHPLGTHKKVVMRENLLIHRGRSVLLYTTDTGDGSSGSPVFNDKWQVVALHHTGGISDAIQLDDGVELPNTVNEGVRASRIALELLRREPGLHDGKRELLRAAVNRDEIDPDDQDAGHA